MTRLDDLSHRVKELYGQKLEGREPWADWLYPNHVLVVASNAKRLAKLKGADVELSQVAGLLHDISDIRMRRLTPGSEDESLKIARELMQEFGYTKQEIALVVDDAIRYHSCYDSERPKSKEGLVLAAADALAHFQTDYYIFVSREFGTVNRPLNELKEWALKKIDRDLYNKISFDDIREEAQPDYDMIKLLFSR